jgi:hypothetical protein
MALEKTVKEDKIEIVDAGDWKVIQVRTATIITDDGTEISRTFNRHIVHPDDDVSSQSDEVKKLAEIYFTDDAKAKYKELGGPA